jgi:hypothetical protein
MVAVSKLCKVVFNDEDMFINPTLVSSLAIGLPLDEDEDDKE